ncbi:hypothetical protein WMF38_51685 [Sorangium sp. So ce118]
MRKVREILRLKFKCKRSRAEIAAAACVGESTVSGYLARAEKAGLTWEVAREMTDAEIESRLFRDVGRNEPPARVPIDFSWVHRELSKPCVTLQTLWLEYREASAPQAPLKPYEYSRFCDLYAAWKNKLGVVMRQVHRAGEKAFIDYSGRKPHLVDRTTGEVTEVELFVAVLGASNYTYAEATRSQKLADFVGSTVRMLEYFGGVPEVLVYDYVARHIIVEQHARNAAEVVECLDVPAHEEGHRRARKEAQEDPPRIPEHHDEGPERAKRPADSQLAEVRPVDLRLLAGQRAEPLERLRRLLGAQTADHPTQMIGTARIAALLEHDEEAA